MDASSIWIYHERQEALLCGQHALNNLVQSPAFAADYLAQVARELDVLEQKLYEEDKRRDADAHANLIPASNNVDEMGNFSIQVLQAALEQSFGLRLPHLQEALAACNKTDVSDFEGFICHRSDHWFAVRRIGDSFWNLNSTLERPTPVSSFALAAEMEACQQAGYTVFCVPQGLPPITQSVTRPRHVGAALGDWYRLDDLKAAHRNGGSAPSPDPWSKLQGSGMRLDGKSTTASTSTAVAMSIEGLTEEEQIQLAIRASVDAAAAPPPSSSDGGPVPAEPAAGAPGSCRIMFKWPHGGRCVRRFLLSNTVDDVYKFVRQHPGAAVDQQPFQLLAGFPPRDLGSRREWTIDKAQLSGDSVQARYL